MTLIETIIYIVLLSFFISTFISYIYQINFKNADLNNEIYDAENI